MFGYDFVGESSWNGYENNCLFVNVGQGQFIEAARGLGADGIRDARGTAIADFDGDGRLDVAVNNNNARPTIYLNRVPASGHWIEFELVGSVTNGSNRDAVGTRMRLTVTSREGKDKKILTRWVEAGSGFASQSAFPLHFGLGHGGSVEEVEITWPSGYVHRLRGDELEINRRVRIEEGSLDGGSTQTADPAHGITETGR